MNNMQLWLESSKGSINLNSPSDGFYLTPELEGLTGAPDIRTTSGVNAGADGGWTSAQYFDARLITIRGVIADTDVAQLESKRRNLVSIVAQGRSEQLTLRFVSEAGNAYTVTARTTNIEMALQQIFTKQEYLIQLRADDPLIYDDGASGGAEAILRVQQALGGFEINFDLPLAIGGSSEATLVQNGSETVYPIINLYGPLHSPTVVNMTTNQQMQIIADLGYTITWSGYEPASGKSFAVDNQLDKVAAARLAQIDGDTAQNGTPTPSAPVPVNTVTGENTVHVLGKNLYDPSSTVFSIPANVSIDVQGYTITATALVTTTSSDLFWRTQIPDSLLEDGKTYTISCVRGSGAYRSLRLQLRNKDGSNAGFSNGYSVTYDDSYGLFVVENPFATTGATTVPAGTTCTISNIQVEEGDSETTFESYREQSYTINLGKNLFDKDNANIVRGYIAGTYLTSGTDYTIYIPCDPNTTYTISKMVAVPQTANRFRINAYNVVPDAGVASINAANFWNAGDGTDTTTHTYTTPVGATYLGITVMTANTTGTTTIDDMLASLQIEKGSQATSYSAYFTPIELCKLGTYQDKIYKTGGKWYLYKEIGEMVFDGSADEVWVADNAVQGWHRYKVAVQDGNPANWRTTFRSNYFRFISSGNAVGGGMIYESMLFCYPDQSITTTSAFTTWLADNPTSVYYPLATPTTTEITDAGLVAQLEAVLGDGLYEGANNIHTQAAGQNIAPTINIEYATVYHEDIDVVTIDSQARTITLNGTDAYHLKTAESEFPVLAPGENRLYLTSATLSDLGYAEVKFKQGYLSI